MRFDWRWVIAIVVLVVLASASRIPWPITAAVLGASGAWVLALGWQAWVRAGGAPSRSRVTYWRGQRIEAAPQRRGPALPRWSDIGPAAIYFIIGGVLALSAIAIALGGLGI